MSFQQLKLHHSFILLQTNSQKIAKSLPYVIYSSESNILDDVDDSASATYNWTFDCSFYYINRKPIILTAKTNLQKVLEEYQYLSIKTHQDYKLYVYIHQQDDDNSKFLEINNQCFIHPEGFIMLEYTQMPNIKYMEVKDVNLPKNQEGEWFRICSEYALLSDTHFLNSLKSGKAEIGSYLKVEDKLYPYIEPRLLKWVKQRLKSAKL